MAISTRVEPIEKDIALIVAEDMSPQARSSLLASFARTALNEGEEANRNILGRIPPHKTFVDGNEGQSEDRVRPDGVIVYEFELVGDVLVTIADLLKKHSPVLTGQFRDSFTLFADGEEIAIGGVVPSASEFVFLNTQPYTRKIERADGVFQAVAAIARGRLGNQAKISFGFRSVMGGAIGAWAKTASARALAARVRRGNKALHTDWLTRVPAIIVKVK